MMYVLPCFMLASNRRNEMDYSKKKLCHMHVFIVFSRTRLTWVANTWRRPALKGGKCSGGGPGSGAGRVKDVALSRGWYYAQFQYTLAPNAKETWWWLWARRGISGRRTRMLQIPNAFLHSFLVASAISPSSQVVEIRCRWPINGSSELVIDRGPNEFINFETIFLKNFRNIFELRAFQLVLS